MENRRYLRFRHGDKCVILEESNFQEIIGSQNGDDLCVTIYRRDNLDGPVELNDIEFTFNSLDEMNSWLDEAFAQLSLPADPISASQKLNTSINDAFRRSRQHVRIVNCLEFEGITTLRELVCRSQKEISSIRNLGEGTLLEITDTLSSLGLHLGMKVEKTPPHHG